MHLFLCHFSKLNRLPVQWHIRSQGYSNEQIELTTGFQKEPIDFEFFKKIHVIGLTT